LMVGAGLMVRGVGAFERPLRDVGVTEIRKHPESTPS
jgi:hypothetical protein